MARKATIEDLKEIQAYVGKSKLGMSVDELMSHYGEQLDLTRFQAKALRDMLRESVGKAETYKSGRPMAKAHGRRPVKPGPADRFFNARRRAAEKRRAPEKLNVKREAVQGLVDKLGAEKDRVPMIGGKRVQTPSHFLRAVSRQAYHNPKWQGDN